jgi:hypothetical protein
MLGWVEIKAMGCYKNRYNLLYLLMNEFASHMTDKVRMAICYTLQHAD